MSWRERCIALLAAQPTAWFRLSEVFAAVEQEIPIHIAMRHSASKTQGEVGLNTARWRLFLSYVKPLVERTPAEGLTLQWRCQRSDFVRLRPHETPCETCRGPRYLVAAYRGRPRRYVCPTCAEIKLPPKIEPAPTIKPAIKPVPELAPINGAHLTNMPVPVIVIGAKPNKSRLNAYQRRGKQRLPPRPQPIAKPRRKPVRPPITPRPEPLQPAPLSKAAVSDPKAPITIVSPTLTVNFADQRTLARSIKNFFGGGSINQVDAELQRTSIEAVLGRRGKTLREFLSRIFFNSLK
jgi:hypothetical protein